MKLTQLTAKNLKGQTFNHHLSPVTMIVGPNGAGKTARLEAARLALLGYDLALGKKPGEIYKLSSGLTMSVGAQFETGITLMREWCGTKTGATNKVSIPDGWTFPAILLDLSEWFGMTKQRRTEYVCAHAIPPDEDVFKLQAILDALRKITPPKGSKYVAQAIHETDEHAQSILCACGDDMPVTSWLADLRAWLDEKVRTCRARVAEAQAATRHTVSQADLEAADSLADITAQVSLFDKTVGELTARLNAARANAELAECSAAMRAKIEAAKDVDLDALRTSLENAWMTQCDVEKAHSDATEKWAAATNKQQLAEADLSLAEARLKDLKARPKSGKCPMCKQVLGAKAATELAKKLTTAQDEIAVCGEILMNAVKASDEANAAVHRLKGILDATVKQAYDLEREIEHVNQLRELPLAEVTEPCSTIEIEADLLKIQHDLSELRIRQRRAAVAAAEKTAMLGAQAVQTKNEDGLSYFSPALKLVENKQREIADRAWQAVVGRARAFTDGILADPLEYRDGEFGRTVDGIWVEHSTFSGSERLLAYAAISVALAGNAPCRIVMLDELGKVDPNRRKLIIQRMVELTKAGLLDNFIGCDIDATVGSQVEGVQLIALT